MLPLPPCYSGSLGRWTCAREMASWVKRELTPRSCLMSPASSLTQTMILNNRNGNTNPGEVVQRACQPGGSILNFYKDDYFILSYLQEYLINSKSL